MEVNEKIKYFEELSKLKNTLTAQLNETIEASEKACQTTAEAGIEKIQQQIFDIKQAYQDFINIVYQAEQYLRDNVKK